MCTSISIYLCENDFYNHIYLSGAKVHPQTLDDIQVSRKNDGGLRRTADDYGQQILGSQTGQNPPNPDDIMILRHELFLATHGTGIYVPAVHVLNPSRFRTEPFVSPDPPTQLPDVCDDLSPHLVPSSVVEVKSKPLPIGLLPAETVLPMVCSLEEKKLQVLKMASLSNEEREDIEMLTRGQSSNLEWFVQRMGAITGSKAWDIIRYVAGNHKLSLERLIRSVMGYEFTHLKKVPKPRKPALKWGISKEHGAKSAYLNYDSSSHQNLTIKSSGLVIHPSLPFIRASPDGIISCSCHGDRLLEIKCPYSARDMLPEEAVRTGIIDYIKEETPGCFSLDRCKRGYFHQIQTTLAVCQLKHCELVVWTPSGMLTVPVAFEADSWSCFEELLSEFFRDYITIEMMTKAVKAGNSHRDLDEVDSDSECVDALIQHEQVASSDRPGDSVLNEDLVWKCNQCKCILPEPEYVADDNSDASVGCDCDCLCNTWFCWHCAGYTEEQSLTGNDWFCQKCISSCQSV